MKKLWIILSIATIGLCLGIYNNPAKAVSKGSATLLKQQIANILRNNSALDGAEYSAYIKVLKSGRVIYSYRGQSPMIPASNLKIITTATGLNTLGPSYRYKTQVIGPKPNKNGVIQGNLYLRGNGDPTVTVPYYPTNTSLYYDFANQLKRAGVKSITGDIVADDSCFDREYIPQGWKESYRLDSYSAPVSALSLAGNLVDVVVTPNGIRLDPSCCTIGIENRTGSGPLAIRRKDKSDDVIVEGQMPGSEIHRQITVGNPSLYAVGVFKNVLTRTGITHKGKVRLIKQLGEPASVSNMHVYAVNRSVPIFEIIKEINTESDNLFAEHLFKTIGAETTGKGTTASGFAACKNFLKQQNIACDALKMVDGCGLSPLNRTTTSQLAGVLEAMAHHPYGNYFRESLATSSKGTLRGRLGEVQLKAKTGTLDRDSSLSGYITTNRGQELVFSIIVNNVNGTWAAVDTQNKIVQLLASWPDQL